MPSHTLSRSALLTLIALSFAACSLLDGASNLPVISPKTKPAKQLQTWQAKGKVNVVFQNKANSAYFHWDNRGEDFVIHFHGPLGQGSVYLRKVNGVFTLDDGKQRHSEGSAEALLYSQLGLSFPVSELVYWIRGIRAPEKQTNQASPVATKLQQKGWTINYPSRERHRGYLLPEKLIAERSEVKLTMVIKRWTVQ